MVERQRGSDAGSSWSPLTIYESNLSTVADKPAIVRTKNSYVSSAGTRSNSARARQYLALQEAINSVAGLDREDSLHLDPAVAVRARDFLGIIAQNIEIAAPKFFPQDGDAAVFTWDSSTVKSLLTVDFDEIALMRVGKSDFVKCIYDVPPDVEEQYMFLMNELGHVSNSSINFGDDD